MQKLLAVIAGTAGMVTVCLGGYMKMKGSGAVSVIGGADGPTSIFIAGKVGGDSFTGMMIVGILLIVAGLLIWRWKRK